MTFQTWNGTCEMKPEHSSWNLSEKSGTNRDLKWDKIILFFKLVWNISAILDEMEWN